MSDDRLKEIEIKLISHDKDIHSIAKSVEKIATSVELQTKMAAKRDVQDEHFNSAVKAVDEKSTRAHTRIDEHDKVFKRVMWLIITPVIGALLGMVIYSGLTPSKTDAHLKELTQAIKSIKND